MKTVAVIAGVAALTVLAAGTYYLVDVDQTQEARMPDVDVTIEEGQMPAYDIETGSIELTTEEMDVSVPDVDVTMEERTVTVPGIDINTPSDDS